MLNIELASIYAYLPNVLPSIKPEIKCIAKDYKKEENKPKLSIAKNAHSCFMIFHGNFKIAKESKAKSNYFEFSFHPEAIKKLIKYEKITAREDVLLSSVCFEKEKSTEDTSIGREEDPVRFINGYPSKVKKIHLSIDDYDAIANGVMQNDVSNGSAKVSSFIKAYVDLVEPTEKAKAMNCREIRFRVRPYDDCSDSFRDPIHQIYESLEGAKSKKRLGNIILKMRIDDYDRLIKQLVLLIDELNKMRSIDKCEAIKFI